MSMQSDKEPAGPLVLLAMIVVLLAALFMSVAAYPSGAGMRCGAQLIQEGFHMGQVKALCGEPASESSYYYRYDTSYGHQNILVTYYLYNFGPNKFMRALRFEGGKLKSIELLGYGYN